MGRRRALRETLLVIVPAAVAAAAAGVYCAVATPRYEAQAQVLVSPVASGVRTGAERKAIARRLAVLDGLAGTSDPTVRVASAAAAPAHPSWPRPWLLVPVSLAAGAAVGLLLLAVGRRRTVSVPRDDPELSPPEGLVRR